MFDRINKCLWWDRAWSLVGGCTPVSEACENCWLKSMNNRFRKGDFNKVVPQWDKLEIPLKTRVPTAFAIWSDLFHESVPFKFIGQAYDVMSRCRRHVFMILTKRPARIREFYRWQKDTTGEGVLDEGDIWLGVTAENQEQADKRIPMLLQMPAVKRFVSIEPMLGPIMLESYGPVLDWVILGGETGPNTRPMHPDWVRSVRDQCQAAGVPLFFKGWGEYIHSSLACLENTYSKEFHTPYGTFFKVGKKKAGRLLDGKEWLEVPGVDA